MNKTSKIIGAIFLMGAAGAAIAAMIMHKNGKLDELMQKFKKQGNACEINPDEILESSLCMIAENSGDDDEKSFSQGKKSHSAYNGSDLKPHHNGRH